MRLLVWNIHPSLFSLLPYCVYKYIAARHYIHQLSLSLSLFCAADIRRQTGTPSKNSSCTFSYSTSKLEDNNKNNFPLQPISNLRLDLKRIFFFSQNFLQTYCNSYINLYSTPLFFLKEIGSSFHSRGLFLLLQPTATTI